MKNFYGIVRPNDYPKNVPRFSNLERDYARQESTEYKQLAALTATV